MIFLVSSSVSSMSVVSSFVCPAFSSTVFCFSSVVTDGFVSVVVSAFSCVADATPVAGGISFVCSVCVIFVISACVFSVKSFDDVCPSAV